MLRQSHVTRIRIFGVEYKRLAGVGSTDHNRRVVVGHLAHTKNIIPELIAMNTRSSGDGSSRSRANVTRHKLVGITPGPLACHIDEYASATSIRSLRTISMEKEEEIASAAATANEADNAYTNNKRQHDEHEQQNRSIRRDSRKSRRGAAKDERVFTARRFGSNNTVGSSGSTNKEVSTTVATPDTAATTFTSTAPLTAVSVDGSGNELTPKPRAQTAHPSMAEPGALTQSLTWNRNLTSAAVPVGTSTDTAPQAVSSSSSSALAAFSSNSAPILTPAIAKQIVATIDAAAPVERQWLNGDGAAAGAAALSFQCVTKQHLDDTIIREVDPKGVIVGRGYVSADAVVVMGGGSNNTGPAASEASAETVDGEVSESADSSSTTAQQQQPQQFPQDAKAPQHIETIVGAAMQHIHKWAIVEGNGVDGSTTTEGAMMRGPAGGEVGSDGKRRPMDIRSAMAAEARVEMRREAARKAAEAEEEAMKRQEGASAVKSVGVGADKGTTTERRQAGGKFVNSNSNTAAGNRHQQQRGGKLASTNISADDSSFETTAHSFDIKLPKALISLMAPTPQLAILLCATVASVVESRGSFVARAERHELAGLDPETQKLNPLNATDSFIRGLSVHAILLEGGNGGKAAASASSSSHYILRVTLAFDQHVKRLLEYMGEGAVIELRQLRANVVGGDYFTQLRQHYYEKELARLQNMEAIADAAKKKLPAGATEKNTSQPAPAPTPIVPTPTPPIVSLTIAWQDQRLIKIGSVMGFVMRYNSEGEKRRGLAQTTLRMKQQALQLLAQWWMGGGDDAAADALSQSVRANSSLYFGTTRRLRVCGDGEFMFVNLSKDISTTDSSSASNNALVATGGGNSPSGASANPKQQRNAVQSHLVKAVTGWMLSASSASGNTAAVTSGVSPLSTPTLHPPAYVTASADVVECVLEKRGLAHEYVVDEVLTRLTDRREEVIVAWLTNEALKAIREVYTVGNNNTDRKDGDTTASSAGAVSLHNPATAQAEQLQAQSTAHEFFNRYVKNCLPKIVCSVTAVVEPFAHAYQRFRIRGSTIGDVTALAAALEAAAGADRASVGAISATKASVAEKALLGGVQSADAQQPLLGGSAANATSQQQQLLAGGGGGVNSSALTTTTVTANAPANQDTSAAALSTAALLTTLSTPTIAASKIAPLPPILVDRVIQSSYLPDVFATSDGVIVKGKLTPFGEDKSLEGRRFAGTNRSTVWNRHGKSVHMRNRAGIGASADGDEAEFWRDHYFKLHQPTLVHRSCEEGESGAVNPSNNSSAASDGATNSSQQQSRLGQGDSTKLLGDGKSALTTTTAGSSRPNRRPIDQFASHTAAFEALKARLAEADTAAGHIADLRIGGLSGYDYKLTLRSILPSQKAVVAFAMRRVAGQQISVASAEEALEEQWAKEREEKRAVASLLRGDVGGADGASGRRPFSKKGKAVSQNGASSSATHQPPPPPHPNATGFLNYFAMNRFNWYTPNDSHPGLHLLKGEYRTAISVLAPNAAYGADALLPMRAETETNAFIKRSAGSHVTGSSNAERGEGAKASRLREQQKGSESKVSRLVKKAVEDAGVTIESEEGCRDLFLQRVGTKVCHMLINEFLSFVWNEIISQRVRRYGRRTILVGDLVRPRDPLTGNPIDITNKASSSSSATASPTQKSGGPTFATAEGILNGLYTYRDVVMPIPGAGVVLPKHDGLVGLYRTTLQRYGIVMNSETGRWEVFGGGGGANMAVIAPNTTAGNVAKPQHANSLGLVIRGGYRYAYELPRAFSCRLSHDDTFSERLQHIVSIRKALVRSQSSRKGAFMSHTSISINALQMKRMSEMSLRQVRHLHKKLDEAAASLPLKATLKFQLPASAYTTMLVRELSRYPRTDYKDIMALRQYYSTTDAQVKGEMNLKWNQLDAEDKRLKKEHLTRTGRHSSQMGRALMLSMLRKQILRAGNGRGNMLQSMASLKSLGLQVDD